VIKVTGTRNRVKPSLDSDGLVIENATQRLTDEVAQALAARRSAHLAMLAVAQENDFTPEIRREFSELRRRSARTMGGPGLDFKELDGPIFKRHMPALRRHGHYSRNYSDSPTSRLEGHSPGQQPA
jgi:hypothetical protein